MSNYNEDKTTKMNPWSHVISAAASAAAFALPVASAEAYHLSHFMSWAYAWTIFSFGLLSIILPPLDKMPVSPRKWLCGILALARLTSIAWLAAHEYVLLPALILFGSMALCLYGIRTKKALGLD